MSPPIRDGSGNSIGSIRLGDGSEIAEVRTGAGDVVFDGGAIPDSVDLYWPADEGSGTTLNPDIGSVTMTLPSDSWASDSRFVGGTAPDLTNNFQSDSGIGVNQNQFTVIFWTSFDSYNGDFAAFAESGDSGNGAPSEGWAIDSDDSSTQVKIESYSASNGFEAQEKNLAVPDLTNNDIMFALAGNENLSNNYRLEIYTRSQHEYTHTFSVARSTQTNSPFMLNSDGWDGKFDAIGVAEGTEMPKSDIDVYWDITR